MLVTVNNMKLYLVWNSSRTECVGFLNEADARYTATGVKKRMYFGVPTIGENFREYYAENGEQLPTSTVEI